MMYINFPITVRLLQNNERGFPLIFTITVVEFKTKVYLFMHSSILRQIWLNFTALILGFRASLRSQQFGFPNRLAWTSLRRHRLSKCTFNASKLVSYEFYIDRKMDMNNIHVKMTFFLSRLFDSFSRRLFDYSTLFPTVTVKFPRTIYMYILCHFISLTRYAWYKLRPSIQNFS
jgi:hypothetical protein